MIICIAQIESIKEDIERNIENHLSFVKMAIELKANLIVFPELSITGYEPSSAKKLASSIDDPLFDPFRSLSEERNIHIAVGMPTIAENGINISMLIFGPNQLEIKYLKQLLHEDELPYFVQGKNSSTFEICGKKIAFGICYESLQKEHFEQAHENKADIYIASVAKAEGGIQKAESHFPVMSSKYGIPVLLSNSIGPCDDFICVGQSAVWNQSGIKMEQFDTDTQGLLVFDMVKNTTTKKYF